ncbi:hypothetical protein BaRGS_00032252 [Batillaria attramentaria]|uniref:Uncharacterized protein n=1 Tax=Batillaria attramentaria TaxID=370345 RepID=A0ABD0JNU4_9CAEN
MSTCSLASPRLLHDKWRHFETEGELQSRAQQYPLAPLQRPSTSGHVLRSIRATPDAAYRLHSTIVVTVISHKKRMNVVDVADPQGMGHGLVSGQLYNGLDITSSRSPQRKIAAEAQR